LSSIIDDTESPDQKNCLNCEGLLSTESKFCKHCGSAQVDASIISTEHTWQIVKQVAIFYLFDIVLCSLANFVDVFKTLTWSIVFDLLMAIIAVTFFCDDWAKNKSVLRWPNFSVIKLLGYITLAIVSSLFVSYTIGWLNHRLFSQDLYYYSFFANYKYAKVIMVFFVAAVPALFEELAYRGYVLEKLLDIIDSKQAIFVSAFLFAIIHMSIISLFWLIPFALLLGYVRTKENTLWYGVFIHFSFNLTVCILEFI
jgi:membrane protease YdiL (CAAX protease family)